jgi:hypothetical protein
VIAMQFGPTHYQTNQDWYAYSSIYKPRSPPSQSSFLSSSYSSALVQPSDSYAPHVTPLPGTSSLDALTDSLTVPRAQDPLDEFLSGKRVFLAKSVEDILGSIYERITLKYENLRQLDYQSIRLGTRLLELENCNWGMNPQIERVRVGIEHEINATDMEKRKEEVDCWRDVVRIKTELRETLREFGQEKRKSELLAPSQSSWTSKNSAGI